MVSEVKREAQRLQRSPNRTVSQCKNTIRGERCGFDFLCMLNKVRMCLFGSSVLSIVELHASFALVCFSLDGIVVGIGDERHGVNGFNGEE